MYKEGERPNLKRVCERSIIMHFLSIQGILEAADFSKSYPDCIVPVISMAIEETEIRFFDVLKTTYQNDGTQWEQEIKYENNLKVEVHVDKIKKAILQKDSKRNYESLLCYQARVLIVTINGQCFDHRKLEKIAHRSNFLDLKLVIFNSVYLVVDPIVPTKDDILNQIYPSLNKNFIKIIG